MERLIIDIRYGSFRIGLESQEQVLNRDMTDVSGAGYQSFGDSLHGNSGRTSQQPPFQHVRQRRQRNPVRAPQHNQTRKNARLPSSAWGPSHLIRRTEKSVGLMTKNLVSPWRIRLRKDYTAMEGLQWRRKATRHWLSLPHGEKQCRSQ